MIRCPFGGGYSRLNESPSEKEGKFVKRSSVMPTKASMKALPKRKGNTKVRGAHRPSL